MHVAVRRLRVLALGVIPLLLSACEFDTYEPDITGGVRWRTLDPPPMDIHDLDVADGAIVAAVGASAVMVEDGAAWRSAGPGWKEPMKIRYVAADEGGDVIAASNWGGAVVRRGGEWSEIPFTNARIRDVAIGPDGTAWVCGLCVGPMLARLDGTDWETLPPPPGGEWLLRLAVLGPDHAIVLPLSGPALRYRDGAWSELAGGDGLGDLWIDDRGRVLAPTYDTVRTLQDDTFVAVADSVLDGRWSAFDCLADGTQAVGGGGGAVAIRRDGGWQSIPIPQSLLEGTWADIDRIVLDSPTSLVALVGGMAFRYDGAAWSRLPNPRPRLRGFFRDSGPSQSNPQVGVHGDDGTLLTTWRIPPTFDRWSGLLWQRQDIVAAAVFDDGERISLTADRHWCHDDSRLSRFVARADYRAVATGVGSHVVAVGDDGMVCEGYGGPSTDRDLGVTVDLNDVWTAGKDREWWVVGDAGTMLRRRGSQWDPPQQISDRDLCGVWGRGVDEVYVAGAGGLVLRWDGVRWRDMECPLEEDLLAVMGSPVESVWVVGREGAAAYHDGAQWCEVDVPDTDDLVDLWVPSHRRAFLLTDAGAVIEYLRTNP